MKSIIHSFIATPRHGLTSSFTLLLLTLTLGLSSGHAQIGNTITGIGSLASDTTGNGVVNSIDVSLTKSKSGQPVDATNFREDVTASNSINSSDVSTVKSKSGTALP